MRHYDETSDALPGHKIMTIMSSTIMAPYFFPLYVGNDINRIYIYKKGLDPKEFGYNEYDIKVSDVLMS